LLDQLHRIVDLCTGDHVPWLTEDDLFLVDVDLDDRQQRLLELAADLGPCQRVDLGALRITAWARP
jgi:hypothetical protein